MYPEQTLPNVLVQRKPNGCFLTSSRPSLQYVGDILFAKVLANRAAPYTASFQLKGRLCLQMPTPSPQALWLSIQPQIWDHFVQEIIKPHGLPKVSTTLAEHPVVV